MTKRALITGAAGQDGRYLAELLLSKGYDVFGVGGPDCADLLEWAQVKGPRYRVVDADMLDTASLCEVIDEARPDEVFNFAGLSSVGSSWQQSVAVAEVNAVGVVRILEALWELQPDARFCQASSADIFGLPRECPQTEETSVAPISPYGASKAYAHFITRSYRLGHGMFACNAIFYNHESPLRPLHFVVRKITHAVAGIKLGLENELRLGNLDVKRDWGSAQDYVRAMWLMLQVDEPDDYIVASGVARSVRDLCKVAFGHVGLDYQDYVVIDPAFFRPVEASMQLGDASKARTRLGWSPSVEFADLIASMVDSDIELRSAER